MGRTSAKHKEPGCGELSTMPLHSGFLFRLFLRRFVPIIIRHIFPLDRYCILVNDPDGIDYGPTFRGVRKGLKAFGRYKSSSISTWTVSARAFTLKIDRHLIWITPKDFSRAVQGYTNTYDRM